MFLVDAEALREPAVQKGGKLAAHFGDILQIDFGRDHAWPVGQLRDDLSPRIDDHRMTVVCESHIVSAG